MHPFFQQNHFVIDGPGGKYVPRTDYEIRDGKTWELYFRTTQGRLDAFGEVLRWTVNKSRPHHLIFQDLMGHTIYELKFTMPKGGGLRLAFVDKDGDEVNHLVLKTEFGAWRLWMYDVKSEEEFSIQREGFDRTYRFFRQGACIATAKKEYPDNLMTMFGGDVRYTLKIMQIVPQDWRLRPLLLATVLGLDMLVN